MNNIIYILNKDNYDFNTLEEKELSLEEIGLIYSFKIIDSNLPLNELLSKYNLDVEKFKDLLQNLELKKIIKLEIDIKEQQNVGWNISFITKKVVESTRKFSYNELFYISELQEENLNLVTDEKERFLRLYNIFKNSIQKYMPQEVLIENIDQYINNLKTINPLTFIWSLGTKPSVKEVYIIYEAMYVKNIKKEIINFLIDYTISTSIYKNFSINFFNKVLENWINNNINSLQEAMEYVKKKKQDQKSKSTNKYIDPNWEEIENNISNDKNYDKLKEIEEMIKGSS